MWSNMVQAKPKAWMWPQVEKPKEENPSEPREKAPKQEPKEVDTPISEPTNKPKEDLPKVEELPEEATESTSPEPQASPAWESKPQIEEPKTVLYEDPDGITPSLPIPDYEKTDTPPCFDTSEISHLEDLGKLMEQMKRMKESQSTSTDEDRRKNAEDLIM